MTGKVVAVEKDRILAEALAADKPENVEVIEGDALDVSFDRLIAEVAGAAPPVKIIGNLPYAISGEKSKRERIFTSAMP